MSESFQQECGVHVASMTRFSQTPTIVTCRHQPVTPTSLLYWLSLNIINSSLAALPSGKEYKNVSQS